MKNKKIVKTFKEFVNEAYVDDNGELQDFNPERTSDDLYTDEEFLSMIRDALMKESPMPKKMYNILSDKHKNVYRKELISAGVWYAINWSNESQEFVIKDIVKYNYDMLEKESLEFIDIFMEFDEEQFPFQTVFIKNIDEILQGLIITKYSKLSNCDIFMDNDVFKAFHPRVQNLIQSSECFIIE